MKRGFMKACDDARRTWESIGALNIAGVETHSIVLGDDFSEIIDLLGVGDTVIVNRLEEISEFVTQLTEHIRSVVARGAGLRVLDSPWLEARGEEAHVSDIRPSSPESKVKGRGPGRPPRDNIQIMDRCLALYTSSPASIRQICEQLGCSERTIYRYLRKRRLSSNDESALPHRPRGRKSVRHASETVPAQ